VHGMDSSEAMLARARERSAKVDWVVGDIAGFNPPSPPDLIFSNAALHWLPGLEAVIPRLARTLTPGGVFAVQVPLSHDTAWYDALREVAADPRWRDRLAGVEGTQPVPPPARWYELLSPLCAEADIWTTTYLHVLEGDDPIVDWMSGTGLRPYLQAFREDEAARAAFLAAYGRRVALDFPRRADGTTLMPFPRLFVMARRAA
ncbi:MAG: methyltransferase domain-containing protein, partial [Caulobacteraceae bacterium]